MTAKQKSILNVSLQLFADNGYDATSTKNIAIEAGVSEGLIFRHFQNKEGLLSAILSEGGNKIANYIAPIFELEDPKLMLTYIIEIPFKIKKKEHAFWRLLYALKWQKKEYNTDATKALEELASKAFKTLGYADPATEAKLLLLFLDGAATHILLKDKQTDLKLILESLKQKYNL